MYSLEIRSLLAVILIVWCQQHHASTLLHDDFNDSVVSGDHWHIPTWQSSSDGTYVGRTQFRVTQHAPLPASSAGAARLPLELFNPTGFSFYGTVLISNERFFPRKELSIRVRARMDASSRGLVGGVFLYKLKQGSLTLHDEIDFELLSNRPNGVLTNLYGNEPLGRGRPEFFVFPSGGTIHDYHDYEIRWSKQQVSWYVDGTLLRTSSERLPSEPMNFYLNVWAPGPEWSEAYDAQLQPVAAFSDNAAHWLLVDQVFVGHTTQGASVSNFAPILLLLSPDE